MTVIRRDVLSKFAGEIVSRFIFLLFFFYVGRKLGTTEFGSLNLALSITYILGVLFLDPGLNLSTIQLLISRKNEAGIVSSSVLSLKMLLFGPLLLGLYLTSLVLGVRLPAFSVLFLAALFTLFTALLEYLCSLTNAYHRMDLEAFLKIFNRIAIVALGIVALKIGQVSAVLWAMWTATFLACAVAWMVVRRQIVLVGFTWDAKTMKDALLAGLPVAGTAIVTAVYLKWDLLVLSYFSIGRREIGWYAGAFKIVEAFAALPTMLGAALFPLMVRLRGENPDYLDRLLRISTKTVLLVSIPIAAMISLFSGQIISAVYGAQYLPGAQVLAVLVWCIVPIFLYFYLVFVNIAAGHARQNLLAGCAALVAGLIANAMLVPRIGYLGAAWAALIANSSFALLATWNVCRVFRNANLPTMLARLTIAGALMVASRLVTPNSPALQLASGLFVYVTMLIALRMLDGDDWSLAMRILQFQVQPQVQQS
jgi:O-antigen/teichoic acid export membrane protein